MTDDDERLAEALAVHRIHRNRALLHVAERIGALAIRDDWAGVKRWQEIAAKLDELMRGTVQ